MKYTRQMDKIFIQILRYLAMICVTFTLTVVVAMAQNPLTAPTNNSERGIQSVITQSRDSLQQRMSSGKPQQQNQELQRQHHIKKPDLSPSDQK